MKNLIVIVKIITGVFICILASVLAEAISNMQLIQNLPAFAQIALYGILTFLIAFLLIWIMLLLEKQKFISIGLTFKQRKIDFITGIFIGILLILIGILILWLTKTINIYIDSAQTIYILAVFAMMTFAAFAEEIVFRGYILSHLNTKLNPCISVIITSLLFTLVHLLNPDISAISALNIFLASIFISYSFLVTKNLWLPVGIHLFWNFTQAMFGFNVSGGGLPSICTIEVEQSNFINGGNFGFEGSIICTGILLIAIIVSIYIYKNISVIKQNK